MARKKRKKKKKSASLKQNKPWYRDRWTLMAVLGLFLVTVIVFSPVYNAEFVNWDDSVNVYENENVINFDIAGIFSEHVIGNYNPLSNLSLAIDYAIAGDNAAWYHKVNVFLHLLNILLVFLVFRNLKFGKVGALAIAILFAIHPMRVESVAWVTERKDLLFALFYLTSILSYLRYKAGKSRKWFLISLLLFILSCLSKIQAVSLPLALILIDYWQEKDEKWLVWAIGKIPYFVISLATGLLGIYMLRSQGSLMLADSRVTYSVLDRIVLGINSLGDYTVKSLIPHQMIPLYPFPKEIGVEEYSWAIAGLLFLATAAVAWWKKWKLLCFGLLFFLVNIIFMLQIVDAGQGYKADRFTYIPYLGLFALVGKLMQDANGNKGIFQRLGIKNSGNIFLGIFAAYALFLAYKTYEQSKVWENSETLWKHQIKYQEVPLPLTNLANYLRDEGRGNEALPYYNRAIKLRPTRAMSHNSRGTLHFRNGNWQQALVDYENAIKYSKTEDAEYFANRGAAYANLGQMNKALADFNKAVEVDPQRSTSYLNRGITYSSLNQAQKAYQDMKTYLQMEPHEYKIHYEMALLSNRMGQHQRALQEVQQALNHFPNRALFHFELSRTYYSLGRYREAMNSVMKAKNLGHNIPQNYLLDIQNKLGKAQ